MADELTRRLVHAAGTLVLVPYLLGWMRWRTVVWFVLGGALLAALLEVLRLAGRLDWWVYDALTRAYESNNPAGYALYAAGMAVVVVGFEPAVAVPAALMLTLGDPTAGLLSDERSAEGIKDPLVLATMFGVCLALAVSFVGVVPAILGAAVATVADGIKPVVAGYVVDDNLTIPVGAAVTMWAATTYLPM